MDQRSRKNHGRWLIGSLAGAMAAFVLPVALPAAAEPEDEQDPGAVVLVIDGSGSMAEPSGRGNTRMEAAKDSLNRVIDELPAEARVGLRGYGTTISDGPGSCEDSELLSPVEELDREALKAGVADLEPYGNTPIAYALEQAAGDLPDEGPRSIVLVSDGEENCDVDPCEVAAELVDRGIDLRIDAVGLQVDAAAREQLSCIASAGGGTYYDVEDVEALPNTLERLSVRAARGYEPAGRPITGGREVADAASLEAGQWLDTIDGEQPRTYALPDIGDGTLFLSATIRPSGLAVNEREAIQFSVVGADGEACTENFREAGIGAFTRNTPVTATAILTADDVAGCGDEPVMEVTAPDTQEGKALELLAIEEAAVENAEELPGAQSSWSIPEMPSAGGEEREVIGTPSFSGAPVLEAGVEYTDTILTGEALFYRVPVQWGQQAVCEATFDESSAVAQGTSGPTMSVRVDTYGPGRGALTSPERSMSSGEYDGQQALTLTNATPEVAYANRDGGSRVVAASLAGDYYCAVFVNRSASSAETTGEIPVTVRAETVGDVSGEPQYVEPIDDGSSDEASADDGGLGGALWWAFGALVLAAAAAVAFVLWRRRPSAD